MFSCWLLDDEVEKCVRGVYVCDYRYQAEQMAMDAFNDFDTVTQAAIFEDKEPLEWRRKDTIKNSPITSLLTVEAENQEFFARILPQIKAAWGMMPNS